MVADEICSLKAWSESFSQSNISAGFEERVLKFWLRSIYLQTKERKRFIGLTPGVALWNWRGVHGPEL